MPKEQTRFRSFFCRVDDNPNICKIDFESINTTKTGVGYCLLCFHETGKNKRPHYHFYIETKQTQRKTFIYKFLKIPKTGVSNSIEKAWDKEACIKYIKNKEKTDQWEEFGKKNKQGERTDLQEFYEDIKTTPSLYKLTKKQGVNMIKYPKGTMLLRNIIQSHQAKKIKERPVESFIFWGSTGKGKTTDALVEFLEVHKLKSTDYYLVPKPTQKNQLWFDGYDGESVIVLDEFDETWFDIDHLKHITDKWIHQYPIKGSFIQGLWDYVVFTSNYDPATWKMEWTPSLLRRIPKNHWIEY